MPGEPMLAVLLVRGLALVEPSPRLEKLVVSLFGAHEHKDLQVQWKEAALVLRPEGKHFADEGYALARVGHVLADSINLQQLNSFCESQAHLKVAGGCHHAASSISSSSGSTGTANDEQQEEEAKQQQLPQQPLPPQHQPTQQADHQLQLGKKALRMSNLCFKLRSMENETRGGDPRALDNLLPEEGDRQLEAAIVAADDAISLIKLLLPSLEVLQSP